MLHPGGYLVIFKRPFYNLSLTFFKFPSDFTSDRFTPKFVKRYASMVQKALNNYAREVREGAFPGQEHSFNMSQDVVEKLQEELQKEGIL